VEYPYFVEDSGAQFAIVGASFVPKLTAALGNARSVRLLAAGGPAAGVEDFDALVARESGELPPADTHRDDEAFWLYSSGSTGRPKGVVHLQHDMLYTSETYAREVLGIGQDDVTFSTTKLFHAYGLGNNLSFPYWAGATTVLLSGRPTPDAVFATVERDRPTLLFSVPTLYNAMLNWEGSKGQDLTSVRACISAAEPLPPEVWHRWNTAFGAVILDGIGSTEMLHIYCSNTLSDVRPGSSGRVVPGYQTRILDDHGSQVAPGETGNLWVSGDSCFAYYWNKPERTLATLRDGWYFSGDRYRVDEEGYHYYEGRADDMFKVSGLWVSPIEVENALMEHPAVAEVAVVGVQTEGFVHAKAFVVLRSAERDEAAVEPELRAFCETRLHRYAQPRTFDFVADLPKTLTGKIQRYKLRDQVSLAPR
jgi:benzoate-CoA ligase